MRSMIARYTGRLAPRNSRAALDALRASSAAEFGEAAICGRVRSTESSVCRRAPAPPSSAASRNSRVTSQGQPDERAPGHGLEATQRSRLMQEPLPEVESCARSHPKRLFVIAPASRRPPQYKTLTATRHASMFARGVHRILSPCPFLRPPRSSPDGFMSGWVPLCGPCLWSPFILAGQVYGQNLKPGYGSQGERRIGGTARAGDCGSAAGSPATGGSGTSTGPGPVNQNRYGGPNAPVPPGTSTRLAPVQPMPVVDLGPTRD